MSVSLIFFTFSAVLFLGTFKKIYFFLFIISGFLLPFFTLLETKERQKLRCMEYRQNTSLYLIENRIISKYAKNIIEIEENVFKYNIGEETIIVDFTEKVPPGESKR